MGEDLDVPVEKPELRDNINDLFKYGLYQVQGNKKTMEDYSIEQIKLDEEKFPNIYGVFGLFDGHGGPEVPKYLSTHFSEYLEKSNNFLKEGKVKEAINETFFSLDKSLTTEAAQKELAEYSEKFKPTKEQAREDIKKICSDEKFNDEELDQIIAFNEVFDPRNIENANIAEFTGATGLILLFSDKQVYIANAGNSICLIFDKEGKFLQSTKIHNLEDKEEKKRVDLARSFNEEDEKKNKEEVKEEYLESTRGFGDWEFKGNEWIEQKDQEVSVEPEIIEKAINTIGYIMIGTNGMFEKDENNNKDGNINNKAQNIAQKIIDKIKTNEDKYSNSLNDYFKEVIDGSKGKKNLDNMSCWG